MRHHIHVSRPVSSQIGLALAMAIVSSLVACYSAKASEFLPSSTPDFPSIVRTHSDQLGKIDSDKEAISLFVSAIGSALQLGDAARTLGANPLQAKLANELLLPDLTTAVHRLMGNLAAWRLASTVRQAVRDQQFSTEIDRLYGSRQARTWLDQQGKSSWHDSLNQLSEVVTSPEWGMGIQGEASASTNLTITLEKAARLELDTMQASYQEWDRIRSWKDRVRGLRGQARLCGTWQWIIHNHQQLHQEQKLILLFPPAGNTKATLLGLAETIVLGENVYLRWEVDGRVQEDSLQFSKEGQRLEGTFVNSEGGWGSISGKKTAGCAP
jgi:hypothetical protein